MSVLHNPQVSSRGVRGYGGVVLSSLMNIAFTLWKGPGQNIQDADIHIRIAELSAERAAEISARLARGNTSIQEGAVVSAEEIDREFGHAPWRS